MFSYCTHCGRQLVTGERFCTGCGSLVTQVLTPSPSPVSSTSVESNVPSGPIAQLSTEPVQQSTFQLNPQREIPMSSLPPPAVLSNLCSKCSGSFPYGVEYCPHCGASVASSVNATRLQGAFSIEPHEVLAMAMNAAESVGLTVKVSRHDYFRADGTKSPGKVLLGGLAYYLVGKPDRMQVHLTRTSALVTIVSMEARGSTGQQALNVLATELTQPTSRVVT